MASQGPNSPGTLVNDNSAGTVAWANPGNAASSNDSWATADNIGSGGFTTSQYLKVTNFGFSIPSGATINGIVLEREGQCSVPGVRDHTIKLVVGGTISGNNKNSATFWSDTGDTIFTYGTSTDLWGLTPSYSDINASNFGAVVRVVNTAFKFTSTASVDHVRITIYYTAGASGPANVKTFNGLATTSIKTINGVAIASVKTINGLN
ncbi:MAG: hypothetical protein KBD52_01820 [Candidatus Pacebacteria bacterium]|nr:hypothetical protein [Candidatus Paceibacterota bacterium]